MNRRTPIFDQHEKLHARIVDFAGWDMPVQYESITAEHKAVRESIGMFDVGHMGRFYVSGPDAASGLSRLISSRLDDLAPGQVRYSVVCNPEGGIKDDVLVVCLKSDEFLIVVNASNRDKLLPWFQENLSGGVKFSDRTEETGMIAIQGPESFPVLQTLLNIDFSQVGYYEALELDHGVLVSRTGYTGELGCEIIANKEQIGEFWGKACRLGAAPCGLGARDILRLEMGFPLYGHELSEDISPLEAGLKWIVHFGKEDFIGKQALLEEKEKGAKRKRIAFQLIDRGIPREHGRIFDGDRLVGQSTSGGYSPILKKGIGLALVEADWKPQGALSIEIRGKKVSIETCKLPFVPNRTK